MISVCMSTYNGEKYLERQLDTILEQLSPEDELVISDDSSSDRTIEIIKSYKDKRIRLFENNHFRSPVYNLEFAMKQAQGDYIFLADQDDVWLPGRVRKVKEKLKDNDLVVCNAFIVDQNEKVIHESYFQWKGSRSGFWKNLKKNSFLGCSLAFNRKVLESVLPFPKKLIMHDVWIGLMAESIGKVCFLDEKLMLYRRHADNVTAAVHKDDTHLSDFSLGFKIWYRMVLLFQVTNRYLKVRSKEAKI
ncbi:MAG: glycosyltransferase family 2 protein [Bacteroidales bacterium]|nr:glycosyltransferase family 2 protein [Bacteroidales bacterium]